MVSKLTSLLGLGFIEALNNCQVSRAYPRRRLRSRMGSIGRYESMQRRTRNMMGKRRVEKEL